MHTPLTELIPQQHSNPSPETTLIYSPSSPSKDPANPRAQITPPPPPENTQFILPTERQVKDIIARKRNKAHKRARDPLPLAHASPPPPQLPLYEEHGDVLDMNGIKIDLHTHHKRNNEAQEREVGETVRRDHERPRHHRSGGLSVEDWQGLVHNHRHFIVCCFLWVLLIAGFLTYGLLH